MITKTYLDGKLDQLEEKIEKKIEAKVRAAVQKREAEISELRNSAKLIEEKRADNKDTLDSYVKSHNDLKQEMELLKLKVEEMEKILKEKSGFKPEKSDAIVSDIE